MNATCPTKAGEAGVPPGTLGGRTGMDRRRRSPRGAQARGRPEERGAPVPIPPEPFTLLRKRIDQYGTAPDGRLFRTSGAASTSRPPSGRCCGKHAQRRSRPLRSVPCWPAGPTTSATPESPGASTPAPPPPGGREGRAQRRDAVPDLRPLHRRRRPAMAQTDGRLPWLAQSPGHGSGASPFPQPDLARCRRSHSVYRWRFAWP